MRFRNQPTYEQQVASADDRLTAESPGYQAKPFEAASPINHHGGQRTDVDKFWEHSGAATARLLATYLVTCEPSAINQVADDIALEQSVEVPRALIEKHRLSSDAVGMVESIEPMTGRPNQFHVRISFHHKLAGDNLSTLFNLIFGNISLKTGVKLIDLQLPSELLQGYAGPKYGVEGIRAELDVPNRPLLATAIKPRGAPLAVLAQLAEEFALGGGDIIKDDHNLTDDSFADFCVRVQKFQSAVKRGEDQTGRRCLYLPNLLGPANEIERRAEFLADQQIAGFLACPFILGLDVVRQLANQYPLAVMAHPSTAGCFLADRQHGIDAGVLFGTLMRLAGSDASIYPNTGGRFTLTTDDCNRITARLRQPLEAKPLAETQDSSGHRLRTAWPTPAGGMRFENLPGMIEQFGHDTILLVGGNLLLHDERIRVGTQKFLHAIEACQSNKSTKVDEPTSSSNGSSAEIPTLEFGSACEFPAGNNTNMATIKPLLRFDPAAFAWPERQAVAYKKSAELPFRDVTRHELIGPAGEATSFEVRYFEIGPGGFSSLEKHDHTHTIIGVRGRGKLVVNGQDHSLAELDIAYVPPAAVHQIRNESADTPFGFFCIVDRDRDRPTAP